MKIHHDKNDYISIDEASKLIADAADMKPKTVYQYIINYIRQTVRQLPSKRNKTECEIEINEFITMPSKVFISQKDINRIINEATKEN